MEDTSTGVMDMGSAVEAAFSAASSPDAASSQSSTETATAASQQTQTDQAQATTQQTTQQQEPGPIPYPRFKEVNEQGQAWKKELDTLAWAKGIKPEHAPHFAEFYSRVTNNPLALLEEVDALLQNPVYAGSAKSWAARVLGQRQAAQQSEVVDEKGPQPDLDYGNGILGYSAQRQAEREAWLTDRLMSQFSEKLQPLAQAEERRAGTEKAAQITRESQEQGRAQVEAMRAKPHFKEHEKDIKAAMLADESLSLQDAYLKVILDKVVPANGAHKAAQVQQKVAANTANPSRPSGAAQGPPKTFREGLVAAFSA